jgi:hypothetical protein
MESKESYERPKFVENDKLELERKARVLHLFMKNFLTSIRLILIFDNFLFRVPEAVEKVQRSENNLNNNSCDSLIAYQIQDRASDIMIEIEVS